MSMYSFEQPLNESIGTYVLITKPNIHSNKDEFHALTARNRYLNFSCEHRTNP